jgi:hypothetical protein
MSALTPQSTSAFATLAAALASTSSTSNMYSQLNNIFQQQQQQQQATSVQSPANYYTTLINTPGFINFFNSTQQQQQQQGQAPPKVTMISPSANNSSSASSSSSTSSTSSSNTSLTEKNKLRTIGGVLYNNNSGSNALSAPSQLYSLANAASESMKLPVDSKEALKNTANALIRAQQQAKQSTGKYLSFLGIDLSSFGIFFLLKKFKNVNSLK